MGWGLGRRGPWTLGRRERGREGGRGWGQLGGFSGLGLGLHHLQCPEGLGGGPSPGGRGISFYGGRVFFKEAAVLRGELGGEGRMCDLKRCPAGGQEGSGPPGVLIKTKSG